MTSRNWFTAPTFTYITLCFLGVVLLILLPASEGSAATVAAREPSKTQLGSSYSYGPSYLTGWVQQDQLRVVDGSAVKRFGGAMDIHGKHLVIGAPWDSHGGVDMGTAYVFEDTGNGWLRRDKLSPADGDSADFFGADVALSRNYAVVGAMGHSSSKGSVYVFALEESGWNQRPPLILSNGTAEDYFGMSVDISNDTIIAGAPGRDANGSRSGSAYIFEPSGEIWTLANVLTASDAAAEDLFGTSVAIDGNRAIVGAHGNDDKGAWSGAAYIFERDGGSWNQTAKLLPGDGDGAEDDKFGVQVAIRGDYAIVGAPGHDNGLGAVYIFAYNSGSWNLQARLTVSEEEWVESRDKGFLIFLFGLSVALSDEMAIIGTVNVDVQGDSGYDGAVYVFVRDGDRWIQRAKLVPDDRPMNANFGGALAIERDTVVIGAAEKDNDLGSVYIFLNLLERYKPVLYFAGQEVYGPARIEDIVQGAWLKDGEGNVSPRTVFDCTGCADHYLDLQGLDARSSETWWIGNYRYSRLDSGDSITVYGRVFLDEVSYPRKTVIQYWFPYFYSDLAYKNKSKHQDPNHLYISGNNHEGDWEMIEVVLDNNEPIGAAYAQHSGKVKRSWKHVEKEKYVIGETIATHPVVYVGLGGHASYFKNAHYYVNTHYGFEWPDVKEETGLMKPASLGVRPVPLENDGSPSSWLTFQGRWGADEGGTLAGGSGTGPSNNRPVQWGDPIRFWEEATWDEALHYGGPCQMGQNEVEINGSRNVKVCVIGVNLRGFLVPLLKSKSDGQVLIDSNTNQVDSTERSAEYLTNCETRWRHILLYKPERLPIDQWEVELGYVDSVCSQSLATVQQSAQTIEEPIEVRLSYPNVGSNEIVYAVFSNVDLGSAASASISLGQTSPQLEIDEDGDGATDATVQPTDIQRQEADFVAPAAISDLGAVSSSQGLKLQWTAPNDDGSDLSSGPVSVYEIRYSGTPITDEEAWNSASPLLDYISPGDAGTPETLLVSSLPCGNYFFAMKSYDEARNASPLSGSVQGTVLSPPGDVNGDGNTNTTDIQITAGVWGKEAAWPQDRDGDDRGTIKDIMLVAQHWGESCQLDGWVTVLEEDFDGSFPGAWNVADISDSDGGEFYWNKRGCRVYNGSNSGWGIGGGIDGASLACGSNYPYNAFSWMTFGSFSLADALAGNLSFKLWLNTVENDGDFPDNDSVFWGASTDGTGYWGFWSEGNSEGWVDKVLYLTDVPTLGNLAGESQVWIAIVFLSNSSYSRPEGTYVDDIQLRKYVPGSGVTGVTPQYLTAENRKADGTPGYLEIDR